MILIRKKIPKRNFETNVKAAHTFLQAGMPEQNAA
jgi:hypothetical protein